MTREKTGAPLEDHGTIVWHEQLRREQRRLKPHRLRAMEEEGRNVPVEEGEHRTYVVERHVAIEYREGEGDLGGGMASAAEASDGLLLVVEAHRDTPRSKEIRRHPSAAARSS